MVLKEDGLSGVFGSNDDGLLVAGSTEGGTELRGIPCAPGCG